MHIHNLYKDSLLKLRRVPLYNTHTLKTGSPLPVGFKLEKVLPVHLFRQLGSTPWQLPSIAEPGWGVVRGAGDWHITFRSVGM